MRTAHSRPWRQRQFEGQTAFRIWYRVTRSAFNNVAHKSSARLHAYTHGLHYCKTSTLAFIVFLHSSCIHPPDTFYYERVSKLCCPARGLKILPWVKKNFGRRVAGAMISRGWQVVWVEIQIFVVPQKVALKENYRGTFRSHEKCCPSTKEISRVLCWIIKSTLGRFNAGHESFYCLIDLRNVTTELEASSPDCFRIIEGHNKVYPTFHSRRGTPW